MNNPQLTAFAAAEGRADSFGRPSRIATAAAAVVFCTAAQAQTWEYKAYKKVGGQYDKSMFNVGEVSLEEKDGKAMVHLVAGKMDACLRGDVPATVTRTDALTTIELQQTLAGCEAIRYVIRNDGSGGDREVKRNDEWKKDGFDHGLTPKK